MKTKRFYGCLGIVIGVLAVLLAAFIGGVYVFRNELLSWSMKDELKNSRYENETVVLNYTNEIDSLKADAIREYFPLDSLIDGKTSTWDKAFAVAEFVNANVKHDNQVEPITQKDAIGLWEYNKKYPTGFNCRYHSILLYELLSSIDIENRPVWCMPKDTTDSDCHVVNHVFLPENGKWVMLDSDQGVWAEGKDGLPMNLPEMRDAYIDDEDIDLHFMNNGNNDFYYSYMAKNTYSFETWENACLGFEMIDRTEMRYIGLYPIEAEPRGSRKTPNQKLTGNPEAFWKF